MKSGKFKQIAEDDFFGAHFTLLRGPRGQFVLKEERYIVDGRVLGRDERNDVRTNDPRYGGEIIIERELTGQQAAHWCVNHFVPKCLHRHFTQKEMLNWVLSSKSWEPMT